MPGSLPTFAVISAESKAGTNPSLSVVQTLPSSLEKEAPALSSPPKQRDLSSNPSTNHLNPTGTSYNFRDDFSSIRSISCVVTTVFPIAAELCHSGRFCKRYFTTTDKK